MKRKRRHLTAEFKARVALEALKGEKTAAEIARENEIAPAQISEWKKQLEDRLGEVFQSKGERSKELQAQERKEARLERKIGQLVIEKDFLLKKCEQLGIDLVEEYAVYMYGDLFFSWCRDQLEWGIVQLEPVRVSDPNDADKLGDISRLAFYLGGKKTREYSQDDLAEMGLRKRTVTLSARGDFIVLGVSKDYKSGRALFSLKTRNEDATSEVVLPFDACTGELLAAEQ